MRHLLRIHAAVFLFGMAGLFGKWLDLPSVTIVFGRVAFASLGLLILLRARNRSLRVATLRDGLHLALLGLLLAVHWISFFESVRVSTVSIALLTFATFPVFTSLLEPMFTGERPGLRGLSAGLVSAAGVALIIPEFSADHAVTTGVLWGILSGGTFSVLSILNRRFVRRYPGTLIALYQDMTAAVVLLPFVLAAAPDIRPADILLLGVLGIVMTAVAHSLFITGLRGVSATTASVIVMMEPLYGIAAAALFLGEELTLRTIFGGAMILAVALFVSVTGPAASDVLEP